MSDRDLYAWLQVLHEWQVATYNLVAAMHKGDPCDAAAIAAATAKLKQSSDALKAAVAAQTPTQP